MKFIVQASSRAWGGGADLCMNELNGKPVLYWTLRRIFDEFEEATVTIVAPEFDKNNLDYLKKEFGQLAIFYGHDSSPLRRIADVTSHLSENDLIVRVDGLHLWFDSSSILLMLSQATNHDLDCVKFPDDFPVQFTSEIFRVGAIRKLLSRIGNEELQGFHVHPKFFLFRSPQFKSQYIERLPILRDDFLRSCREAGKAIYKDPRLEMNSSRIISGDQLTYHYMRALAYLRPEDVVLDVASGMGLGAKFVAEHVRKVICADIDRKIIEMAQELHKDTLNMDFMCQDVTHMEFEDGTFDAVLSMETFEHMPDAMQYCREINRVLRKDGRFIMSTPQNALGNIAVIAQHVREYSIQEVRSLLTSYFEIDEIIGIKAGVVSFPDDPIGSNMIVLAIKR